MNLTPEKISISSGEVGLLVPSKSEGRFGLKAVKILEALQNLHLSLGQSRMGDKSDG